MGLAPIIVTGLKSIQVKYGISPDKTTGYFHKIPLAARLLFLGFSVNSFDENFTQKPYIHELIISIIISATGLMFVLVSLFQVYSNFFISHEVDQLLTAIVFTIMVLICGVKTFRFLYSFPQSITGDAFSTSDR
jgi:hypothetical protein